MNAHHDAAVPPGGRGTRTQPALLSIVTDAAGRITAGSGRWPGGGVHQVGHLAELVHDRNHDLLERMLEWVCRGGAVERAVGVQLRSVDGWHEALATAVAESEGVRWTFVPALADPMRALGRAVTEDRDLTALVELALQPLADAGSRLWGSMHFGRDTEERYRRVVASPGHDTFRRAIDAAVAGEDACPWDEELDEHEVTLSLGAFGDGIVLAGPRCGLGAARLVPIPGAHGLDAACLAVWTETPGLLEAPDAELLLRRVAGAATLAFQVEGARESQRTLATRDGLTGLWNRAAFFAQLDQLKAQRQVAIILADIDDFRAVNDWHGYAAGDEVLALVAGRLRQAVRPGDMVARVGADEFAILCEDIPTPEAAEAVAQRVLHACEDEIKVGTEGVVVGLSIGIAITSPERIGSQLFGAAERTMLEVKAAERGTWGVA